MVFGNRNKSHRTANVISSIGHGLEDECQMRYYEREYPNHMEAIKKFNWHSSMGTQQKLRSTQTLINRREDVLAWRAWNPKQRVALGAWMLDAIMAVSGWFEKSIERQGKRRSASSFPRNGLCGFTRHLWTLRSCTPRYDFPCCVSQRTARNP